MQYLLTAMYTGVKSTTTTFTTTTTTTTSSNNGFLYFGRKERKEQTQKGYACVGAFLPGETVRPALLTPSAALPDDLLRPTSPNAFTRFSSKSRRLSAKVRFMSAAL